MKSIITVIIALFFWSGVPTEKLLFISKAKEIRVLKIKSIFIDSTLTPAAQPSINVGNKDSLMMARMVIDSVYIVVDEVWLNKKKRKLLGKEFLNKKNFVSYSRKCEFLPEFAFLIDNKITVLLSTGNCPKIQYYYNSTPKVRTTINLSDSSMLETQTVNFFKEVGK